MINLQQMQNGAAQLGLFEILTSGANHLWEQTHSSLISAAVVIRESYAQR